MTIFGSDAGILVRAEISSSIVVVEHAHPKCGYANLIGYFIVGDGSCYAVIMDGRSACCIGESDELQAHFELQVRVGYGPLHIGLGDFDDIAISPERTTGCRTTPYLGGHLEGYEAFEIFRSNGP